MNIKNGIWIYLKGVAMGASDVIPGVSGGTIAFITGIYERLINAVKSFNLTAVRLLFSGQFRRLWRHLDAAFLLCLLGGIVTSFLSLAKVITWCMDHYPALVWSFFFGLVLASAVFVGRGVKWNVKTVAVFLLFTLLAFFITSPERSPLQTDGAYWYIFLCGAIAVCAMILPGISGSFILILLGGYYTMMHAIDVQHPNLPLVAVFIAGAGVGLLSFSNLLSWLFRHAKRVTLAALTGFMLGSLNKIWPWKETLETFADSHGKTVPLVQMNILPHNADGDLPYALGLMLAGLLIIFVIEWTAAKLGSQSQNG